MEEKKKPFQRCIFAVSDASGRTCETVIRAALTQFQTTEVSMELFAEVTTPEKVQDIFRKAAAVNGVVVYTMVEPELRQLVTSMGRMHAVPTVDLLGPLLSRFSDLLEISPLAKPGLFRQLDDEYFKRIEAVDYTIKHDDGLRPATINLAEIILVGVSRSCKTPVSIYLAFRGWKVANVPVIPDMELPREVMALDQRRIVCLTMQPARLALIRKERQIRMRISECEEYTDRESVEREVTQAMRLYHRNGWPVVDVTFKSVEETSTEIMRLIYAKTGWKKGKT